MMGSPVLPLRMLLMQQSNREKMWILDLHTRIYILRDWYSYLRNDVLGTDRKIRQNENVKRNIINHNKYRKIEE